MTRNRQNDTANLPALLVTLTFAALAIVAAVERKAGVVAWCVVGVVAHRLRLP